MDLLQWRLPFILFTLLAWSTYVLLRKQSQPSIVNYWGFRYNNLLSVLRRLAPLAALAVVSFLVIGYTRDTINPTWHIIPILITYPIWGTVQQFLCVGLVTGNLQDMRKPLNMNLNMLITAVLFSVIHYPDPTLMAGTFVLALVYSFVYIKQRNLYALGLFHGWLGALFYYTVVGRDPFMEVFDRVFH